MLSWGRYSRKCGANVQQRGFYFTLARSSVIGSPPGTAGLTGSVAGSIERSLSERCLDREESCLFARPGDTLVKSGPTSEMKVIN